jgi:hypothetical protein
VRWRIALNDVGHLIYTGRHHTSVVLDEPQAMALFAVRRVTVSGEVQRPHRTTVFVKSFYQILRFAALVRPIDLRTTFAGIFYCLYLPTAGKVRVRIRCKSAIFKYDSRAVPGGIPQLRYSL